MSELTRRQAPPTAFGVAAALQTLVLGVVLFFPAFALHEALHAAVVTALGAHAEIVIRPWPFATVGLSLPSVHVQPVPPLSDAGQLADNFLGPALAAVVCALWALAAPQRVLRYALAANAAALVFYALIEALDVVSDSLGADLPLLTTPEFNYGVPLALFIAGAVLAGTR